MRWTGRGEGGERVGYLDFFATMERGVLFPAIFVEQGGGSEGEVEPSIEVEPSRRSIPL